LLVLLPPLLFDAAFHLRVADVRRDVLSLGLLAVLGVVATACLVGGGLALLTPLSAPIALLFGALISATDREIDALAHEPCGLMEEGIGVVEGRGGRAARHRGATNVRVFGSVARGDDHRESDVDILVDPEPGRSLLDLGGLLMDLQRILGRRVHLVTEKSLYHLIRDDVLAEGTARMKRDEVYLTFILERIERIEALTTRGRGAFLETRRSIGHRRLTRANPQTLRRARPTGAGPASTA